MNCLSSFTAPGASGSALICVCSCSAESRIKPSNVDLSGAASSRRLGSHVAYFDAPSLAKASTGDSNAMKSTQGPAFLHSALCGSLAGPYA